MKVIIGEKAETGVRKQDVSQQQWDWVEAMNCGRKVCYFPEVDRCQKLLYGKIRKGREIAKKGFKRKNGCQQ